MHIRSDVDESKERYGDTVEMFLTEYPNGTVHKRMLLTGTHLPTVIKEDALDIVARPKDLPLGQFSDDEWSSEDEF